MYTNEFEPAAMLLYVFMLYQAISLYSLCYQEGPMLFKWVKVEVVAYTCLILGIFLMMLLRTVMSKLRLKLQFSVKDLKTTVLTDALSQHHWDAILMQSSVTDFAVSLFIYFYFEKRVSVLLTAVSGAF